MFYEKHSLHDVQVHGNNPVLNQQAKERLNLDRELAGDEEKAFAEIAEEDRQKRQQLLQDMANELSQKLDGNMFFTLWVGIKCLHVFQNKSVSKFQVLYLLPVGDLSDAEVAEIMEAHQRQMADALRRLDRERDEKTNALRKKLAERRRKREAELRARHAQEVLHMRSNV